MMEVGSAEPCPTCKEQAILEERQRVRREAEAAFDGVWTLPPLQGSPKQISWATDIRAKTLKILIDLLMAELDGVSLFAMVPRVQDEINRLTDATTWINRRFLLESYARSIWKAAILRDFSKEFGVEIVPQEKDVLVFVNGLPYRRRWFKQIVDHDLMRDFSPDVDWYDLEMFVLEQLPNR